MPTHFKHASGDMYTIARTCRVHCHVHRLGHGHSDEGLRAHDRAQRFTSVANVVSTHRWPSSAMTAPTPVKSSVKRMNGPFGRIPASARRQRDDAAKGSRSQLTASDWPLCEHPGFDDKRAASKTRHTATRMGASGSTRHSPSRPPNCAHVAFGLIPSGSETPLVQCETTHTPARLHRPRSIFIARPRERLGSCTTDVRRNASGRIATTPS